jgi:Zn-dependent protease
MDEIIRTIAVYALPVVFAITLHEAAHAYAAKYFGDSTAFVAGRMTLDPFKHIDPFGTIVLPLLLYMFSKGAFVFGYARPVPVDFNALRNPRKHGAFVALAGPLANFAMAFGWLLLGIAAGALGGPDGFAYEVGAAGLKTNLLMFAFNLVPIPPLDGGRVLASLLPNRLAYRFAQLEPYGFFIVMALVYTHMLDFWVITLMNQAFRLLSVMATPLNLFLS